MSFDANTLPAPVRDAFKLGHWVLVVQEAIKAGITDIDELADIVFFLHHPERNGRPLDPGDTFLIDQWKSFRTLIRPILDSTGAGRGLIGKIVDSLPGKSLVEPFFDLPPVKRTMPVDLSALQYAFLPTGELDHAKAFDKGEWGDGQKWIAIATVSDLIELIKSKCGRKGYVRTLRLGGHGATSGSFRLGNVLVSSTNIDAVAMELKAALPYFMRERTLVQLDHCYFGRKHDFIKRVSKAFGGAAVVAPYSAQYTEPPGTDEVFNAEEVDDPDFSNVRNGRLMGGVLCGPQVCFELSKDMMNMPPRDHLKVIQQIDPSFYWDNWSR